MKPSSKLEIEAFDEHVGKKLRQARKLKGLSQTALGELVQLTFQQVQKHEVGVVRVSAGRLFAYSRALGVPLTFFFEELAGEQYLNSLDNDYCIRFDSCSEKHARSLKAIANANESDVALLSEILSHFRLQE